MTKHAEDYFSHVAALKTQGLKQDGTLIAELNKLNPCNEIAPAVVLDPDGWFRAIDQNNYDVDCNEDGFFTTSPEGYGRTPLDAIIDLLDNMADFERADAHIAKVNA